MDSYGFVYQYQNLMNGKKYYGQTTLEEGTREKLHLRDTKRGSQYYFHKALRKYGRDNFKKEILYYCPDQLSLSLIEDIYINLFSLSPKGYNLKRGGSHGKFSRETKEKISESRKGQKHSIETKKKMSESRRGANNSFFGKHHSESARKKMSKIKENYIPWNKGKHHSKITREKISESRKGQKHSIETKKKIGQKVKETFKDPIVQKRRSKAMEERYIHFPQLKEQISNKLKGRKFSEETIQKLRDANRKASKIKKKCEYCGKSFSIQGFNQHKKACKIKNKGGIENNKKS